MASSPKKDVNAEMIRTLAELLNETGLKEIEYGTETWHIRVVRDTGGHAVPAVHHVAPHVPAMAAQPAAALEADNYKGHPGLVASPMVGVVYTSPEPGQAPFVKVGDTVAQGDTLLLIEAMKVFNPIKAPKSGRIARVMIGNEDPVEYGEPLMIIE